jgi:ubiquinone/menaquinone biosynthesis C-methylase UbiE
MNPLNTDYVGHDSAYQRLKAEGAYGWTSEEDHTQVVRPRILRAITQLSIPSGSRILDLGCGTGDIAIWLGLEGYEAYGIDIAPSAIAWANEKAQAQQSQVQFTVGSVLDLTAYPDNFFHLVVDGRCLHCIIGPHRAATLASIHRVLQPGGGFLVQSMCGEVMEESPMKAFFDPVSRCTINREGIATRYIGDAGDILEELTAARFAISHSEIVPRQGPDDQDDLVALAVEPS